MKLEEEEEKNCELRGCHALHRLQNRCQSYIVSRIASMKKQHEKRNEFNALPKN